MAQIYGALALLGVYFAAALLILIFSPGLISLPEIVGICNDAGLSAEACRATAMNVAAQELLTVGMVAVVTFGLTWKSLRECPAVTAKEPFAASPELMSLLLAALAAVLVTHNVRHAVTGLGGQHYRPEESALVSMESLAWPLLLQLVLWSRQLRWRMALLAFLAAIAAISPFRNTIFSMLFFGALIPFASLFLVGHALSRRTKLISFAAIAALFMLVLLIVLYQTGRRLEGMTLEAGPNQSRIAVVERGLESRALTPFFQAALVDHLVRLRQPLPGIMASLAEKMHLGYENLNEYVFNVIYQGYGQTTTLYYGEAKANTRIAPIYWEFAAPLALVLCYFLLRPAGDVGALIGIALWRSSMGGLFDVLTALAMQLGFCLVLTYLQHPMFWTVLRYVRLSFAAAVVAVNAAVATSPYWAPRWRLEIDPQTVSHEIDHAYMTSLKGAERFPYLLIPDTSRAPHASRLQLFENGKSLGPPHSVHAQIRADGGGHYSHWYDFIYFSASDGSDPRTNGRQYVATDRLSLPPAAWKIAVSLDVLVLLSFWRPIWRALPRRSKPRAPQSVK